MTDMNDKKPFVSIIIPTFNGRELTLECLDSINRLEYPKDRLEVIISDSCSNDGSPDAVRRKFDEMKGAGYRKLQLIESAVDNGAPAAYNRGVKASDPETKYFWHIDNDVVMDEDYLKVLIEDAEHDPKVGIICGKVVNYKNPKVHQHTAGYVNRFTGRLVAREAKERTACDYAAGCGYLIKRKVMDKLGGLVEEYFIYGDDIDFCLKAKKLGYEVVCNPKTTMKHRWSATMGLMNKKSRYYDVRNKFLLIRNFGLLSSVIFNAYFFLVYTPYYMARALLKHRNTWEADIWWKAVSDYYANRLGRRI